MSEIPLKALIALFSLVAYLLPAIMMFSVYFELTNKIPKILIILSLSMVFNWNENHITILSSRYGTMELSTFLHRLSPWPLIYISISGAFGISLLVYSFMWTRVAFVPVVFLGVIWLVAASRRMGLSKNGLRKTGKDNLKG